MEIINKVIEAAAKQLMQMVLSCIKPPKPPKTYISRRTNEGQVLKNCPDSLNVMLTNIA